MQLDLTGRHVEITPVLRQLVTRRLARVGRVLNDSQELFGVASVRSSKRVEFVVQLERWAEGREYDRLGLDPVEFDLLGCGVAMVRIPMAPGRNLAILTEVAARNQLMRARGRHAASDLAFRLDQRLQELTADTDGTVEGDERA